MEEATPQKAHPAEDIELFVSVHGPALTEAIDGCVKLPARIRGLGPKVVTHAFRLEARHLMNDLAQAVGNQVATPPPTIGEMVHLLAEQADVAVSLTHYRFATDPDCRWRATWQRQDQPYAVASNAGQSMWGSTAEEALASAIEATSSRLP